MLIYLFILLKDWMCQKYVNNAKINSTSDFFEVFTNLTYLYIL